MPVDHPDKTYYCTKCRIETSLARVCPKCHRKTTLRTREQSSDDHRGTRRRASATATGTPATAPWPRWVWPVGGAAAAAALVALIWWGVAHWGRQTGPQKTDTKPPGSRGPAAAMTSSRVFGAPRPGRRLAPQGPPRICGMAYRVSILSRFAAPPDPAKKKGTGPTPKRAAPRPQPKGPDALEHRHSFLVAKSRGRMTYVPLAFEVRITFQGRTVTALKMDRTGGLIPDRRNPRQPRRLGYHDSLQPGLRISDLIGRVGADLSLAPRGGLKVTGQRLKNRLVSQWLQTAIDLTRFLHPRSPTQGARIFEDRRLPPGVVATGLKNLVRRFRLQPAKKPGSTDALITYGVDAPPRSMRRAHSTTPVKGQVVLSPAEPLPRKAELRLDNVSRKGGGTQTITVRLDSVGQRCNDK